MKISAYTIDTSGKTQSIDAANFAEKPRDSDLVCWIDIEAFKPDELVEYLKGFGLSTLALNCCRDAGSYTRVVPMANELFFEFSAVAEGDEPDRMPVSVLCTDNLVVTLHQEAIKELRLNPADLADVGLDVTMSGMIAIMLLTQSTRLSRMVRMVNDKVESMDDRLDHNPAEVTSDEIHGQKDMLRVLDNISSEQSACFQVLVKVDSKILRLNELGALPQVIAASAQFNHRTVVRLEKRLGDLAQRFDMFQQDKTNGRLAALTVISAVFLPLTLIAGIWGMNFDDMPELHMTHAYPIALMGMALLAGGLTWIFYKRGWFE